MLKSVNRRHVIHAGHSSWPEDCDFTPRYLDSMTIDPSQVTEAWGTLSEDTFPLEIAAIPAILHRAFKCTLEKRAKQWHLVGHHGSNMEQNKAK